MQMAHMKFKPHKLLGLILFLKSQQILKYLSNIRLMMHYQTGQTRMSLEGNTKVVGFWGKQSFSPNPSFPKIKAKGNSSLDPFVCFTQTGIYTNSLHYQDQSVTSAMPTQQDQVLPVSKTPQTTVLYRKSCYHHTFFSRTTRHILISRSKNK